MRSLIAFSFLFSLIASAAEPSVFGAGDLNNPNPYGLTNEEKLILENKKEIQAVVKNHNAQNAKVETVSERIDGLQAIVEGLAQASNEQRIALQKVQENISADANDTLSIDEMRKQVVANTENITQFKSLLEELSTVVDGINTNYVSKEEFSALIKQLKVTLPASTASAHKSDNASIEKEAKKFFEQKNYSEAQRNFEMMVQKKYKVPEAYFMIGESYFERKSYKEAVAYYKQSAGANEKALYMPTLLLHSGISMEKTGDSATAKAFYQATVAKYSGSGAAKEASEHLSKLK